MIKVKKTKLRIREYSENILGTEFHNIMAQGAFNSKILGTVCFSQFGGVEYHSSVV